MLHVYSRELKHQFNPTYIVCIRLSLCKQIFRIECWKLIEIRNVTVNSKYVCIFLQTFVLYKHCIETVRCIVLFRLCTREAWLR